MKKDIALLVLRVGFGAMMLWGHGINKLMGFAKISAKFPDPIGVGSTMSLGLTVFAEVFCSLALILGLFTKYAAIPLAITMFVAFFIIHGEDPFKAKELALAYGIVYVALTLMGSGKFSLDHKFKKS